MKSPELCARLSPASRCMDLQPSLPDRPKEHGQQCGWSGGLRCVGLTLTLVRSDWISYRSLVANQRFGSQRELGLSTKAAVLDCEPKLGQCRPPGGDTGDHDNANGADQWRPFASTCPKILAIGSARFRRLGRSHDRTDQLCVGARCCLACHSRGSQGSDRD